jgi:excisionase family DNA binding protein
MTRTRVAAADVMPMPAITPAWVTAEAAAVYTSLTAAFIKAAFRNGELPGYRHGHRTLRFKVADLDAWMSAAEVKAARHPSSAQVAGITPGFRTNPSRRARSA